MFDTENATFAEQVALYLATFLCFGDEFSTRYNKSAFTKFPEEKHERIKACLYDILKDSRIFKPRAARMVAENWSNNSKNMLTYLKLSRDYESDRDD